jgi:hypothetical protein
MARWPTVSGRGGRTRHSCDVVEGQVTFYDYDDPTCTPVVVSAGEGCVDSSHGHIGRNETDEPARDISVILAPVGGAFRGELAPPGPYCDF